MICPVSPIESFIEQFAPGFTASAAAGSWDWICEHGRMPDGTPFDGGRVPWCRGVCDAWDDPAVREISLQWGTRLGKTTIGLQLLAKSAATKPRPGLFATSTQSLAERTVRNKIYPVLSSVQATAKQLPHKRWWTTREVRLDSSPWYVAWSGSDTQLADLSAFYGYGNEIDKWNFNEKQGGDVGEGDPLDQFLERFKEFHNAKILLECSPSTKRKSRIEKRRLASNDCRYGVPCPRCGGHQVAKMWEEGEPGGVRYDLLANGDHDPALARTSARYECEHCRYEIHDDQRPRMMRSGVWFPKGTHVDKRGRVKGTPDRGPRLWGGKLSSLYSLQLRWGDIAEQAAKVATGNADVRMWVNGWLAETWEPHKSKTEPEQLGERIAVDVPRGVIPEKCTWLFAAVDKQIDHYVWGVFACDGQESVHIVDHGTCDEIDELESLVIRREFEHQDGGAKLSPALTLIDCGFRAKEIYQFCQRFKRTSHKVFPIKGANSDCAGEPYQQKVIGANQANNRTKKALLRYGAGLFRFLVSPYYYEPIMQDQIDNLSPGDAGALTIHEEARTDLDLLRQLCNGAESEEPSKLDPNRHLWVKRWENESNDYRDILKYARCAMDILFKRDWRKAQTRQGAPREPVKAAPVAEEEPSTRRERMRGRRMERRERGPRERRRR